MRALQEWRRDDGAPAPLETSSRLASLLASGTPGRPAIRVAE
jgi:hypothetical protein